MKRWSAEIEAKKIYISNTAALLEAIYQSECTEINRGLTTCEDTDILYGVRFDRSPL